MNKSLIRSFTGNVLEDIWFNATYPYGDMGSYWSQNTADDYDQIKSLVGPRVARFLSPRLRSLLPSPVQAQGQAEEIKTNLETVPAFKPEWGTSLRESMPDTRYSLGKFATAQMERVRRAHRVGAVIGSWFGWKRGERAQTLESAKHAAGYLGSLAAVTAGTTELSVNHITTTLPGRDGDVTVTIRPNTTDQEAGFDVQPPLPELVASGVALRDIEMAATVLSEARVDASGGREIPSRALEALPVGASVTGLLTDYLPTFKPVEPIHLSEPTPMALAATA